ncbi:MAG: hypothetical protein KDC38_12615 [Planctomycetes bacterium]|nr:hypothetical protein [Planctomycetota bacterium]
MRFSRRKRVWLPLSIVLIVAIWAIVISIDEPLADVSDLAPAPRASVTAGDNGITPILRACDPDRARVVDLVILGHRDDYDSGEAMWADVETYLHAVAPLRDAIEEALQCPAFQLSEVDDSLEPDARELLALRAAGHAAAWACRWHVRRGEPDLALEWAHRAARLGVRVRKGSRSVTQFAAGSAMVSVALSDLWCACWEHADESRIARELEWLLGLELDGSAWVEALKEEHATLRAHLEMLVGGGSESMTRCLGLPSPVWKPHATRNLLAESIRDLLRTASAAEVVCDRPPIPDFSPWRAFWSGNVLGKERVRLLRLAHADGEGSGRRCGGTRRLCRTALALLQHSLRHGTLPADLGSLTTGVDAPLEPSEVVGVKYDPKTRWIGWTEPNDSDWGYWPESWHEESLVGPPSRAPLIIGRTLDRAVREHAIPGG